jgi:Flp pilus assembly protein TadG
MGDRASAFARDRRGNVAMMWGLMGSVLVGLIGITVDFTRAQALRAQMQNATDGAALVAERMSNYPLEDRTAAALAFFNAEMGDYADDGITFNVTQLDSGGHQVTARMAMELSLARIVRNEDWDIAVQAEAEADASPPIEVVLALDNTGSMASDMDTLREGAETLVDFLLGLDGDTVSVGLVPFVAQVNIGNDDSHLAWMDEAGVNPHHGEFFEDRYMGRRNALSGVAGPAGCVGAAYPTTFGGFAVTWVRGEAAHPGTTWDNTGRCFAFAPSSVNIFDLYNNLPVGAAWRGCVEARPEPYDIDDTAPGVGTPATMFVPFFSPDEGGDDTSQNNWVTSSTYDRTDVFGLGGSFTAETTASSSNRTTAVYKYRAGAPVSINDVSATTSARGPNRGCPTPITPLSTDNDTVVDAVRAMRHWYGGGTNQIEGLSWAWRVISPTAPFTEGRPYDDPDDPVRKVIVLFTDGDNTSLNTGNDALEGDYSAMAMRRLWTNIQTATAPAAIANIGIPAASRRIGITSSGTAVTYMNDRQELLCEAIKDEGIEIYAIGFRIAAGGTADLLLQGCANQDGTHFYHADNQAELLQAFAAIGSGIGALRITH